MSEKQYTFNGLAGCVSQRRSRLTGHMVGVYHAEQAGLDDDPSCKWFTVCECHNMLVGHVSLALANSHAAEPTGWCEPCRIEVETKSLDVGALDPDSLAVLWAAMTAMSADVHTPQDNLTQAQWVKAEMLQKRLDIEINRRATTKEPVQS